MRLHKSVLVCIIITFDHKIPKSENVYFHASISSLVKELKEKREKILSKIAKSFDRIDISGKYGNWKKNMYLQKVDEKPYGKAKKCGLYHDFSNCFKFPPLMFSMNVFG